MASPAVDRFTRPDSSRPAVVARSSATIRAVAFIETVGEDEAAGPVAAMYETDRETFGFVPNFTKAYSARPAGGSVAVCAGRAAGRVRCNGKLDDRSPMLSLDEHAGHVYGIPPRHQEEADSNNHVPS